MSVEHPITSASQPKVEPEEMPWKMCVSSLIMGAQMQMSQQGLARTQEHLEFLIFVTMTKKEKSIV